MSEKQKFKLLELFLKNQKKINNEHLELFNFINFNELKENSFTYYLNLVSFENLTNEIYNKLIKQLNKSKNQLKISEKNNFEIIKKENLNINKSSDLFFEIKEQKKFNKLELKKNEQVDINCPNGIIRFFKSILLDPIATASSVHSIHKPQNALSEIVDENKFEGSKGFCSNYLPDQWLKIEFKKKISINSYIMKYPSGGYSHSPSNFVLEISLNGTDWTEVDRQNGINFKGSEFKQNLLKTFECNFIRIKNIGPSTNGSDILTIPHIDFFGSIIEKFN